MESSLEPAASGKPVIIKVVITTDGKSTFTMNMMASQDNYDAIKKDWTTFSRASLSAALRRQVRDYQELRRNQEGSHQ